jgi:hypothetical protein
MIGAGRATGRYRWFHVSVRAGASNRSAPSNIVRIGVNYKLWSAARPAIAARAVTRAVDAAPREALRVRREGEEVDDGIEKNDEADGC